MMQSGYELIEEIRYTVRKSSRAKRVIVRVSALKGVEVIIPHWFRDKDVPPIVDEKRDWIHRQLKRLEPRIYALESQGGLPESIRFEASGKDFSLHTRFRPGAAQVRVNGDRLFLSTPDEESGEKALREWLKREAKSYLLPILAEEAAAVGIEYSKAQIRLQKGRWGSCSARGTISLNARLMFLPFPLVRYVLLHELAHRRHHNHSKLYWRFLETLVPGAFELDRKLEQAWQYIPRWSLIV